MTLSNRVLLIEDDANDQQSIGDAIRSAGYELDVLTSSRSLDIYNFTVRSSYFVVIVDEILSELEGGNESGFDLIVSVLCKLDSSMRFIHFSKVLGIGRHSSVHALPSIKYLRKERLAEQLSADSLRELVASVEGYYEMQIPSFRVPDYYSVRQIFSGEVERSGLTGTPAEAISNSIRLSGDKLARLTVFATALSRLGAVSEVLCLCVFGSYGRFEARSESDIELSVLQVFDVDAPIAAPVSAWNKAATYCREVLYLLVEGSSSVGNILSDESARKLGVLELLNVQANSFVPVYSVESLVKESNLHLYPHLYFRHYQILSEMLPVFNPDLLDRIKLQVLQCTAESFASDAMDVLLSQRMRTICGLVLEHMSFASSESSKKRFKALLFRTVGVLTFRVMLAHLAKNFRYPKTESDISRILQLLAAPPIVKLQVVRAAFPAMASPTEVLEKLINICGSGFGLYATSKVDDANLRRFESDVEVHFSRFFALMKSGPYRGFNDRFLWVFDEVKLELRSM